MAQISSFLFLGGAAVLSLAILIFVHELGHFLLAKWNNVGVVEFAIGFGKKVFSKKWGETTYSLRLIPLGGYVRMVGDDPREINVTGGTERPATGEMLIAPSVAVDPALLTDRSRWFLMKGYWPKFSIVLAGPAFNLIFAVMMAFTLFVAYGAHESVKTPVIGGVIPKYPAEAAGILEKDLVTSIDGKVLTTWVELAETVAASGGREMSFVVERAGADGVVKTLTIPVKGTTEAGELAVLDDRPASERGYKIGIVPDTVRISVGLGEAATLSVRHVYFISWTSLKGIWGMVSGRVSAKNIGGPIFIFKEAANSAKKGIERLVDFMILISVSLAILNLLPIPVLDGGHLAFFTIEALRGKPLSLRAMELFNQVGMTFLLALMLFAFVNDIFRFL